ncbi:MAG TPA: Sua5/YciO/YrdC/YwlC family protein, partial [Ktedonobacteraceae bacterium]|nr:Sua5/YciO/YrdC/YwlC family protein [Ktedonobacteraceae bacterium]
MSVSSPFHSSAQGPVSEQGPDSLERRRIVVQGIVQGVGFRPFVYAQARRYALAGFVFNDSAGVTIEVEGASKLLEGFVWSLLHEAPPLARIDHMTSEVLAVRGEGDFAILSSQAAGVEHQALISPDTALCAECLRELFDPADRRYRYPFINCTNCGPRFTIIQDVPYDREKTTMAAFSLCPACQRDYEDPLNRRFHAQPNACPDCGPQLAFQNWTGRGPGEDTVAEPLAQAVYALAHGAILAIKGLGGYHLSCDALDDAAVKRLRQRKHREARPFAVMVPNLATASQICEVSAEEKALLEAPQRPIVLLRLREGSMVSRHASPDGETLGVMLPYTPLHYLLMYDCAASFEPGQPVVLVMTSGNLSEEPIVYRDTDLSERLAGI